MILNWILRLNCTYFNYCIVLYFSFLFTLHSIIIQTYSIFNLQKHELIRNEIKIYSILKLKKLELFLYLNLNFLTVFLHNHANSMSKSSKSWIYRTLVVDEFHLNRFHRSNRENRFAHTSAKAGEEPPLWIKLSIRIHQLLFHRLKSAKSYCRLWYRTIKQNRQASV